MKKALEFIENLINAKKIELIIIGCSLGGFEALETILHDLPQTFSASMIICQHLSPDAGQHMTQYFSKYTLMPIHEAEDDLAILKGHIYFAPAGYHLLIESNKTFSLDVSEKVSYCRPSIDVLFKSAALAYKYKILAIILSGANQDGLAGAQSIHQTGGLIIVQDPSTAKASTMPQAIIDKEIFHAILSPKDINELLKKGFS
jgi:two-component system, chemotaxis family, protein-glutamate methylesterase/glutaminase